MFVAFGFLKWFEAEHSDEPRLLRLAITFGETPREGLIKNAARELGFERTGKRISARIESVIQSLVQQGRLRDAGDERLGASS